ncbi:MAG TPA: heparan-alpha-glucosaminide N-acetyltransferase domain-containing protein [Candidatus Angelobacter sp.]
MSVARQRTVVHMSSSVTENTASRSLASRLISIDVMRGLTVAFMILVNNNGQNDQAYRQLNHSPWNGFTATDLVFPTFLFIMGISLVLSIEARLSKGFSAASYITHTIRRFVILFLLGLVVNGFPFFHLGTLRIYGVLQRIALCYLVASLLLLVERGVASKVGLLLLSLVGYWILMRWMPVPGYGVPGITFPILDNDVNLVAYIDRHIFPGRLFEGTRDPEGLLSTLPAIGSTLIGMLAGMWLRSSRSAKEKLTGMNIAGICLLVLGYLWGLSFPINKKLWTSSYVLFAAGWSLLILSACYYALEMKKWRGNWTFPWLVVGTNAITAYVLSELLSTTVTVIKVRQESFQHYVYRSFFSHIVTHAFGSLMYSICFVIVCWIPVYVLYRKKIFIKV